MEGSGGNLLPTLSSLWTVAWQVVQPGPMNCATLVEIKAPPAASAARAEK